MNIDFYKYVCVSLPILSVIYVLKVNQHFTSKIRSSV